MPPHMRFRLATAVDTDTIAALHTASWRSAYRGILTDTYLNQHVVRDRTEYWRASLNPPAGQAAPWVVLAEDTGGSALGFAAVHAALDPQWGRLLHNLHVLPECKGRGLGKLLLAAAAHEVASTAGIPLHLWVYELNVAARDFYVRQGGEAVERAVEAGPDGSQLTALRFVWREPALLGRHAPALGG